jgi:hypothetical protein
MIANMRYKLPAAGLAMAAGVAAVRLYATGEDDYYGDGTTRWEHATSDGGTGLLTALFAVPALIAFALIVLGLLRRRTSELWLIPAFAIYGLSLVSAWAALSLGH